MGGKAQKSTVKELLLMEVIGGAKRWDEGILSF
jgi:hypothetical protein